MPDIMDQSDQTDTLLTIFNYKIYNNVWSIEMICVSLHIERNKLKQIKMKATIETRRKELTDGNYLLFTRSTRTNANGIKQGTPWHCTFDSRIGY